MRVSTHVRSCCVAGSTNVDVATTVGHRGIDLWSTGALIVTQKARGMATVNKDTVKSVAEEYGFNDLNDECSSALAADLEYRLREIIQVSCVNV